MIPLRPLAGLLMPAAVFVFGCASSSVAARAAAPEPAAISPAAQGASGGSVDAFAADPMRFFFELKTAEAIEAGQILLAGNQLQDASRGRVLTALGAIHLATGRPAQARAAFLEILRKDPGYDLERPEVLPPPVVSLFYSLRDSAMLAVDRPTPLDIRTLAVGDIENNSIVPGKFDLDKFARGLTHIMISDLREATPLTIVDRQRLAVIRQELEMSRSEMITDPKYRVPLGKLTGAQSFLFGSILQAEKDKVRLDIRWVNTETGEILLAEGVEAKLGSSDDLFKLERKVLLELLLPQIHAMVGAGGEPVDVKKSLEPYLERKKKELPRGSSYVDLLLKTGEAVLAEERGDFAAARTAWQEVESLNPADAVSGERALALNAFVELGAQE